MSALPPKADIGTQSCKAVWISIGCKGRQWWRTDGSFGWQLLELPNWVAVTWMIVWAFLGYIFAPYRMWKHHRKQIASSSQVDKNNRRRANVCDEICSQSGRTRRHCDKPFSGF